MGRRGPRKRRAFTPPPQAKSTKRSVKLLRRMPLEMMEKIFLLAFRSAPEGCQPHHEARFSPDSTTAYSIPLVCKRWHSIARGLPFSLSRSIRMSLPVGDDELTRISGFTRMVMRDVEEERAALAADDAASPGASPGAVVYAPKKHQYDVKVWVERNRILRQECQPLDELFHALESRKCRVIMQGQGLGPVSTHPCVLPILHEITGLVLSHVHVVNDWGAAAITSSPLLTRLASYSKLEHLTLANIRLGTIAADQHGRVALLSLQLLEIISPSTTEVTSLMSALHVPSLTEIQLEHSPTSNEVLFDMHASEGSYKKVQKLVWRTGPGDAKHGALLALVSQLPLLFSLHLVHWCLNRSSFMRLASEAQKFSDQGNGLRVLMLERCEFWDADFKECITSHPQCAKANASLSDITLVSSSVISYDKCTQDDLITWMEGKVHRVNRAHWSS